MDSIVVVAYIGSMDKTDKTISGKDSGKGVGKAAKWDASRIPDLSGRTAVVTGANSGIGFAAAAELARAGAHVVFAVRDLERGR
ncbi:SDR family NAD(P)-dependent oxidoreductase, partial [Streptomyces sp. W16]|uniref:SDR family NAD(P)-dependent oxidoreductase n=1 Tax=Streptomyces sp. W16 TaxID=3076631 RepID=UPI00295BBCE6